MTAKMLVAALVFLAPLSVPALAQTGHEPSPEQAMALWCHGALDGMSKAYAKDGNNTAAASDAARAEILLGKARALLQADGVSGEEADAVVAAYMETATGEIFKGLGEPQFEENDCNALAER